MKPKAQTMSQRFGFMDPDLTTPDHDAIMLWLDGEMENIVKRYRPQEWQWYPSIDYQNLVYHYAQITDDIREEARRRCQSMRGQIMVELSLENAPSPIVTKVWESPIVDKTYTIGFCDMMVSWKFPAVNCRFNVVVSAVKQESEFGPVLKEGEAEWEYAGSSVYIPNSSDGGAYFEVKPSIPSLGEAIRQIRMYQTYTGNAKWWIVSPDARFKEQIEAQGIKFLVVPSSI